MRAHPALRITLDAFEDEFMPTMRYSATLLGSDQRGMVRHVDLVHDILAVDPPATRVAYGFV